MSSNNNTISPDMLQALLSVDATERRAAETQLQSISLQDRITTFVQALSSSESSGNALLHMVAVLLRRDILKLNAVEHAAVLQNMVSPLLQTFLAMNQNNTATTTSTTHQTAVGNCLAEIGAVLEATTSNTATTNTTLSSIVVTQILTAIAPTLSSQQQASGGVIASWNLLVALAERVPATWQQVALGSLPQLIDNLTQQSLPAAFQQACETASDDDDDDYLDNDQQARRHATALYTVATKLVVQTAIAVASHGSDSDDNSKAAAIRALATPLLLPLLQQLATLASNKSAKKLTLMILEQVLPLWMQAAQSAVDLLTAEPSVWQLVSQQFCVPCIATGQDAKLALQASHVLLLCCQQQQQGAIMMVSPDQKQALLQATLPRLLDVLHSEVDSDVDEWAEQVVSSFGTEEHAFGDEDGQAGYAVEQLEGWIALAPAPSMALTLPLLEQHLTSTTGHGDWSRPWAAIVCVQACAEAAPIAFGPHIPTALQAALQLASSNNNLRVQYQAIQLLAVLCETRNSIVWEHFGQAILQALAQAVVAPCDRVQAMACSALVAYCRIDPQDKNNKLDGERFVAPYLKDLLHAWVAGPLSNGSTVIRIRAVESVTALCHVAGVFFVPYYSNVMPVLLTLAQQQQPESPEDAQNQVLLQSSAVEAATILGQSLGEEHVHLFQEDATRIMGWVLPVLQQQASNDDNNNTQVPMDKLLSACARIASVAGEAYAPYAATVVPLLLARIQKATDVEIAEGDLNSKEQDGIQVDEHAGTESVTVAIPGKGVTKLVVNTTSIEEKAQAIRGIYEHAIALEESFGPYVKDSFDVLLPLVKFQFSSDVRSTAAQSLSSVFEAGCCANDFALCSVSLPKLVLEIAQQVEKENEMDALYGLADALSEIMFSTYSRRQDYGRELMEHFSVVHAKTFASLCLKSALIPCLERRAKITSILANSQNLSGEDEVTSYTDLLREEEKLMTPLVDSVGYTLKLFGEAFYPVFKEEVSPILGPCLNGGGDVRATYAAVCLFDDCVEFCGPAAAIEVANGLVNGILVGLNDSTNGGDNELKQAAVYGVIQLSLNGPPDCLVPHASNIVNAISAITSQPKEQCASEALFENCIAAMASLFLIRQAPFRSLGILPLEQVLNIFLKNIPLSQDPDLAQICHSGLAELVESGQIDVTAFGSAVAKAATGILEIVRDEDDDLATGETCSKLTQILAGIHNSPTTIIS